MVTATAEGNFPMQICHEDPNIHSTTFFFSFYATPSNNDLERRAFFDYVVPLYFQSNENSTMRLSTLAVASIMFYAWMDRNADSPLARTYYLRAVSAMKEQLSHPDTCSDDEMLMSVLLLQMYEVHHLPHHTLTRQLTIPEPRRRTRQTCLSTRTH